jgi:hypothetical protein
MVAATTVPETAVDIPAAKPIPGLDGVQDARKKTNAAII